MAERKAFQLRGGEIQAPPQSRTPNALGQGLEEFGARLQQISAKLIDNWVDSREREELAKGTKAGAEGTFRPVRSGTRAGEAYDRAGLEAYFERLKVQTNDDVQRIYDQNKDDPAKLENAIAGYRDGIEGELTKTMPELVPHFGAFFDRSSRPFRRQAASDYERSQVDQARADTSETLASLYRQHEQRAFLSRGDNDGIADIAIGRQEYTEKLLRAGPKGEFVLNGKTYEADPSRAGAFDVATIGKELQEYDRAILGARIKGEFDRAMKAGRGERFVERFQADNSKLGEISLGERDDLAQWMRGQLSAARSMRDATDKALASAVDAAVDAIHKGETPGGLDGLVARTRGSPAGEALRLAIGTQDRLTQFYRMPPEQQVAALEGERTGMKGLTPAVGDEAYARETKARTALIEGMQRAQQVTVEGLKKDPFGFAVQVGNAEAPPPLIGGDGLLSEASLKVRDGESTRLTEIYKTPVPPMMDAEIDALGQLQTVSDPVTRTANLARMVNGFGPDKSLALLERMDKKGYLVDAAAGSVALDGAPELAQMIYQGDAILQPIDGKPSPYKFPDQDFDTYFASVAGTAFALNPRAELTVKEAVKRIYVANLARAGQRPDAPINSSAVRGAFESVLGGALIEHSAGMFGGRTFVTPPFRGARADDFSAWWDSIDAKTVKDAGGLAGWSDEAAAEIIRDRGLPVEIGQGIYKVVIPGAGELDLTATAKSGKGNALVLRFQKGR